MLNLIWATHVSRSIISHKSLLSFQALFHSGIFVSPSCAGVHLILFVIHHISDCSPHCGLAHVEITGSHWSFQLFTAKHLNLLETFIFFTQTHTKTHTVLCSEASARSTFLCHLTFPQSESVNVCGKGLQAASGGKNSYNDHIWPPLFSYRRSSNATLSGLRFCLYKACSFWCGSHL